MENAEGCGIIFNSLLQEINLPVMAFNCLKAAMSVGFVYMVNTVTTMPAVLLSIYAGTIGTLGSLGAGALSGLTALTTSVGTFGAGVATKVITPMMTFIASFIGTVARDEAYKAYDQTKTNKTVTDNAQTVDVEVEKAKKSMFRQFANFCEEKCPGSGEFVFLVLCTIPSAIFKKLFNMCCNSEKNKKEAPTKIDPPAPVKKEGDLTPVKRTRARNKSPGRKP